MANKKTPSQLKAYHNRQAKKGATRIDRVTGEVVELSDYARGIHRAKADQIHRAQVAAAKKHKEAGTYRPNEK